jgi:hypothetical protein
MNVSAPHWMSLSAAGVRDVAHARGSKHYQLRWARPNGEMQIYSMPGTPSDYRSVANTRAEVRRLLREDGFLVDREPTKPRPLDRMSRLEQRVAAVELELAAMRNDRGNRNRRDEKGVNTHG